MRVTAIKKHVGKKKKKMVEQRRRRSRRRRRKNKIKMTVYVIPKSETITPQEMTSSLYLCLQENIIFSSHFVLY
jgi:hypothetical protein